MTRDSSGDRAEKSPGRRPGSGPRHDSAEQGSTSLLRQNLVTKRTKCPVCGELGASTGLEAETLWGRRQQFLRCPNCRLLFDTNPQDFRYEEGFYIDNPFLDLRLYLEKGASTRLFAYLVLQAERALNLVRRGRRPKAGKGTMWEVGCGPGLLLDLASYSGWKTLGMEPAPEAAKWGNDVLGVPIITKSLRRRPPLTDADVVIATEVDPDILLIDEILAVGDAQFQHKCIARIEEFRRLGKTIVLVSHAMATIRQLCPRATFLDGGTIVADGPAEEVLAEYIESQEGHHEAPHLTQEGARASG